MPESSTFPGSMRVQARGDARAEVRIYGDIGDPWDPESPQAVGIVSDLAALDVAEIDLRVNSYGGSVADGLAIFNALLRHPARVTGHNDGVAASMGSAILMAAEEVVAADSSVFMVHAPWGFSMGNASDMRAAAEMLDTFAATLSTAYARRVDASVAGEWMSGSDDVWFTAAEAVESGLADRLASDEADGSLIAAALGRYQVRGSPMRIAAWLKTHHVGGRTMPKRKPAAAAADDAPETPEVETEETAAAAPEGEDAGAEETSEEVEEAEASGAGNVVSLAAASAVLAERNAEVSSMFEPFRSQPHMAALERHYLTDSQGLQASADAVSRAILAKLGEGIEPAGRGQFDDDPNAARRGTGAAAAGDGSEFERLVQGHVDGGMKRGAAVRKVTAEHPDAHAAYLRAANPGHDSVAAMARISVSQ